MNRLFFTAVRLGRVFKQSVSFQSARSFHNSLYALKRIVEVVPALGESITEGSIARWEKKEGDSVSPDDVVVVIETDKVSVDIKANYKGVIIKLLASENVRLAINHINNIMLNHFVIGGGGKGSVRNGGHRRRSTTTILFSYSGFQLFTHTH